jgi:hypothetical protein
MWPGFEFVSATKKEKKLIDCSVSLRLNVC